MSKWNKTHTVYSNKVDKQALGLDYILRKYEPEFNTVVKGAYRKWAVDDVLNLDTMYEVLTPHETRLLKKQIRGWITKEPYINNKQFINKMTRVLGMTKLRRSDWLDLNLHKVATKIKGDQYPYIVDRLYNDWLDSSRTTARLLNVAYIPTANDAIYKTIGKNWHGSNLFKRVFDSAYDLGIRWLNLVKNALGIRGKTLDDVSPAFKEYFKKGDGRASNLLRIEATRINTEAKQEAFIKNDVEYFQFIATMDSKTTKTCIYQDLKLYRVDKMEIGVNAPPMQPIHVCRSSIRAYDIDYRTGEKPVKENEFIKPIAKVKPKLEKKLSVIEYMENEIVGNKYETALIFDKDGKIVTALKGDNSSVIIPIDKYPKIHTLTHNHPTGNSFSGADISLAISRDMASIRAVGEVNKHKVTYELKIPKDHYIKSRKNGDVLTRKRYDAITRQLQDKYEDLYLNRFNEDEYRTGKRHTHEVMQTLSKEMGFDYTRTFTRIK